MATLSDRASALAARVGNYLRDSVNPRLIPASGTVGQILSKKSATAYDVWWVDPDRQVGAVVLILGSTALTNTVKLNGALLLRADFPELWVYANTSGNIVSEANWAANPGSFSSGDGSTTFRLPDLRGYFLRVFDDGRGIDASRALGKLQDSQNKEHRHFPTANTSAEFVRTGTAGNGGALNVPFSGSGLSKHTMTTDGGAEARPINIPVLACIKYK